MFHDYSRVKELTDRDMRFVHSFGTPEKPVELPEFLEFWNSFTDQEQWSIIFYYGLD